MKLIQLLSIYFLIIKFHSTLFPPYSQQKCLTGLFMFRGESTPIDSMYVCIQTNRAEKNNLWRKTSPFVGCANVNIFFSVIKQNTDAMMAKTHFTGGITISRICVRAVRRVVAATNPITHHSPCAALKIRTALHDMCENKLNSK